MSVLAHAPWCPEGKAARVETGDRRLNAPVPLSLRTVGGVYVKESGMQINRLFEIVYILLNRGSVTARELAERFEVSQRTIYRDVEVLSQAGVPVFTSKGKGGGIGLMDSFVLNKSVLSPKERNEILSALQSLNATRYPDARGTLSKLNALFGTETQQWIEVDFSDWGFGQRDAFDEIKRAILERRVIEFEYFSSYEECTQRTVEPIKLWYKDKAWYLRAYCRTKEALRTFKLSRMRKLQMTEESFERRTPEEPASKVLNDPPPKIIKLRLRIDASLAYRVYDEFDESQVVRDEGGDFLVWASFPEDEWVIGFVLSFGDRCEVLEPEYFREVLCERLKKTLDRYGKYDTSVSYYEAYTPSDPTDGTQKE